MPIVKFIQGDKNADYTEMYKNQEYNNTLFIFNDNISDIKQVYDIFYKLHYTKLSSCELLCLLGLSCSRLEFRDVEGQGQETGDLLV